MTKTTTQQLLLLFVHRRAVLGADAWKATPTPFVAKERRPPTTVPKEERGYCLPLPASRKLAWRSGPSPQKCRPRAASDEKLELGAAEISDGRLLELTRHLRKEPTAK
jgi:hypothetical protein